MPGRGNGKQKWGRRTVAAPAARTDPAGEECVPLAHPVSHRVLHWMVVGSTLWFHDKMTGSLKGGDSEFCVWSSEFCVWSFLKDVLWNNRGFSPRV